MRSVTVQEAKAQLSRLLRDVEAGEEIEIRRGRAPVARLSAARPTTSFREMRGTWAHLDPVDPSVWEPDPRDADDFGIA